MLHSDNFFVRTFHYNSSTGQTLAETFEEAIVDARREFEHNALLGTHYIKFKKAPFPKTQSL